MKLGFATQLWLRDDHFENFHRMLDEMSLIGFDGFEMAPGYLVERYECRPSELRRLLDMHELELSSYYLGMTYGVPEERERGVAEFKRRCRFVAELGYQNVLLDGGRKRPNTSPQQLDDHIKIVAETANMLGKYARSLGLALSWHQHWGSIDRSRTGGLLPRRGSAYLGRFRRRRDGTPLRRPHPLRAL